MPYKSPKPIAKLVKEVLGMEAYEQQGQKSKLVQACRVALPVVVGRIEQVYIKKGILYVKLNTALLSHELRLNKTKALMRIQEAYESLGGDTIPQNIVFL